MIVAAACLVTAPKPLASQPTATAPRRSSVSGVKGREGSLRSATGIAVADRLLGSDDAAERLRGIERLSAIGTPEAIEMLLEAMEQGAPAGRDPKARLLAVRALADHAQRDSVRQLLTRELSDATTAEGRGTASPLSVLTRSTAALALARAGERKALSPLVTALLQGGAAAEAASRALTAYPPTSIAPFLEGKKRLSPQLATFLGELGDLRAIERLRAMLTEPDQAGKAAAAIALAKLGDEAALSPARSWLGGKDLRLSGAAAEVLTQLGAAEAPQAIATLLANDAQRVEGVRLISIDPSPALAKALATAITALPEEERPQAVAALGRSGGAEAVRQLTALLAKPELAMDAAFALALMPDPSARAVLDAGAATSMKGSGAADPASERLLLRAGIVRALVLRDPPDSLATKLEARVASKDPNDRAVAALGLVATGARDISSLLEEVCPALAAPAGESVWKPASSKIPALKTARAPACDEVMVRAAARGALARGTDALKPLMGLLQALKGALDETAIAAGVALLAYPDGGDLPTSLLSAWAEAGGPLAPLAARALPSRDDSVLRGRIKRLLNGSDPVIRAHVALGLGRDPEADAVSLLTSAYRFEEDPMVRRAIVRALSGRSEAQRTKTLVLARDLDPDATVRALARSALGGRSLDDPRPSAVGAATVWITLAPNDPSATGAASSRAARIVRADGIAVPVVSDPDGVLIVPALPPGSVSLLLARPGAL